MRVNGHKQKSNPALDQLTIEELEQLLYIPDGEKPDIDLMTEVLEVIEAREKEKPQYAEASVEVNAAWKDFKENYMGQAEAYELADKEPYQNSKRINHNILFLLRHAATVAAVLALFCATTSAFGFDIFKAIADWTAETFHFSSLDNVPIKQDVLEDDPYEELRAAVAEETDLPVVPVWAPEKIIEGNVTVTQRLDSVFIYSTYVYENREYSISVIIYDSEEFLDTDSTYQKDNTEIETIKCSGIEHYVMRNNKTGVATWINESVQVYIQGGLSSEELKGMIDSVYWE